MNAITQKALNEARDWYESRVRKTVALDGTVGRVLAALRSTSIPVAEDWWDVEGVSVTVAVADWERVDVDVHQLDAIHEALPVIEALEAAGFVQREHSDHPSIRIRRVFMSDDVSVWFHVKADAAGCKVVETGEFRPVTKFVCPGDADYPIEAAEVSA